MESAPHGRDIKQEVLGEEIDDWLYFLDELENKNAHNDIKEAVKTAVPDMELYNRLKSEYLEEVTSYLRTKADWDFTPEFARTLHEVALAKLITLDGMKES